jgi:uncharacterized protein YaiI (UPF0178 family)
MQVWVDADSCPVKDEVYRVARRYGLPVQLVAASWFRTPDDPTIHLQVVRVEGALDAADDWLVEHIAVGDIAISDDIILGSRCLDEGAYVLTTRGREFTKGSIGEALATRELMADLREAGLASGGPAPFTKADRSQFLQRLDEIINRARRKQS